MHILFWINAMLGFKGQHFQKMVGRFVDFFFFDLRRLISIPFISRLGRRWSLISKIVAARPGVEPGPLAMQP